MISIERRAQPRSYWSPVIVSGILRGILTCLVFFNLISYFQYGSVLFGVTAISGILGNLLFLGVVGLITSLITRTGTRAFEAYGRTFIVALFAYVLLIPVLIVLMPNLPPNPSFADAQGARDVVTFVRSSSAMQVFRYGQGSIFLLQMILLYRNLLPLTQQGRAAAAATTCFAIYVLLFVTGII